MPHPRTAPCKACGVTMHWAKTPNGSWVPLQRVSRAYVFDEEVLKAGDDVVPYADVLPEERQVYISHFEACPKASSFSKGDG